MSLKNWQKGFGILTTAFILLVIAISTAHAGGCCDVVKDGLVACYSFDGNANDASGNGNHGTAYGNVSYVAGKIGQSAFLDGEIGTHIDTPIQLTGKPENQYITISLWGYWSSCSDGFCHFITNINAGAGAKSVGIAARIMGMVGPPNGQVNFLTLTNPNEWHHYALTYDNSVEKIYLDGQLFTQMNIGSNLVGGIDSIGRTDSVYDRHLNIGTFNNAFGYTPVKSWFLKGMVDDVRIYNRALSETEIRQLYNCPNSFTITASAGTGGTISPSGSVSVNSGESKTFSVAPAACYDIDNVLVNGSPVTLTNGQYTFPPVTANQTISATFKQNPCCTYSVQAQIDAAKQAAIQSCKDNPASCGLFGQTQLDQAVKAEQLKWDANGDGKIGLEDIIRMLQVIAGLRP